MGSEMCIRDRRYVGVECVGEQDVGVPVTVDVTDGRHFGVREVDAESRYALVGENVRTLFDKPVDDQRVLTLYARGRETIAVGKKQIQISVEIDVDSGHTFGPTVRAGEHAGELRELLRSG